MTQLHSIHHGSGIVRPTNGVDIVLHIETSRGVASETANTLRSLGYELRSAVDPRSNTAHRFSRGTSTVDLVASRFDDEEEDVVDVLVSDHHAPRVTERLSGRDMVRIEGGTQALRRTNPDRHLRDAVALLACIDDPFAERAGCAASDRSRLLTLHTRLTPNDSSWAILTGQSRIDAQTALAILSDDN